MALILIIIALPWMLLFDDIPKLFKQKGLTDWWIKRKPSSKKGYLRNVEISEKTGEVLGFYVFLTVITIIILILK